MIEYIGLRLAQVFIVSVTILGMTGLIHELWVGSLPL